MARLGKLEEINLRTQWQKEDRDFTPWLSKNLDLLSEVLGIDLELKETEVTVGSYSADILARSVQGDVGDVVVENQLGESDHNHLGKIITYGAGLDAAFVVWVCEKIREEHRTAIDWLNKNSKEGIGFFALEIKLWKIGDSKPAPKFEVVCKPDEWSKFVKSTLAGEITEIQQLLKRFWNGLKEYMEEKGTLLRPRKPTPRGWYAFAIGKSGFKISLTARTRYNRVGCELYISRKGEEAIDILERDKDGIEKEIGAELDWQRLKDKEASRIVQYKNWDIRDEEKWEEIFAWLKERAETFYKVFKPRVKRINV